MSDGAIVRGALRVGAFVLVAKAMVAFRDVTIAWQFGAGAEADAFNVAFAISTWLPLFLAGAIGSALVPALMKARNQSDHAGARVFLDELTGHAFLLAAVVFLASLGIAWLTSLFMQQGAFGGGGDGAIVLMLAFAPFAGLTTLFYFFANRLQALGSFSYSMFEGLPGLVVAFCIVTFGYKAGLSALIAGVLVGGVVQVIILRALLHRREAYRVHPRLTRSSEHWNLLLAGIGIMAIGQALLSLVTPIDQYFALQAGPGVPATFGYASRIVGLATSVGTLVLGRALLPAFAEMAQNDPDAALGTARRWTGLTLILGVLAIGGGWNVTESVVRLLFERGSFTPADTLTVTRFVQLGLLQLPFYFSGIVAVQWLLVSGRFTRVAIICLLSIIVKSVALFLMLPQLGADSLMLSTAVMYGAAWIVQAASLAGSPHPGRRAMSTP
jgi:peptidoglycan biosynthesis protein MviN/MurJ (putative lipid II flippase)